MADFNNLFGKDRDVVQETSAQIGQKLRVAANGTELEGFELFAESTAGTAGASTDDYVFTYNMTEAKWQLSNELVAAITTTALDAQIADGSSDFGLYLPSPDTVTPPSIYFNVQSAGDVPDPLATFFSFNGKDYDYTTGSGFGLSQSAGNYFISLFDNDLGSFIAGNNNDTLTMPVAQYPTAGASTPNVTTVTGDLKVTGLSAGSVVSDADGNLSIGSGGGAAVNPGNNTIPVSNADCNRFCRFTYNSIYWWSNRWNII